MNQPVFIFTEIFNCAKIGAIALKSFLEYHNLQVHVYGFKQDFDDLGEELCNNNNIIKVIPQQDLSAQFSAGHEGTAIIFASAFFEAKRQGYSAIIHFDTDVFFLKESISIIEAGFRNGCDIVGSRRTYANNPADIKGLEGIPDTISTYFFGMKLHKVPEYDFATFTRMCLGGHHPLGYTILDFFDPVTHMVMYNGGVVHYTDAGIIGGQTPAGNKITKYQSNLHMDFGNNLVHFGGVGSGYAFWSGKSRPSLSYANWAVGRWSLFAKMFYNEDIGYTDPTVYKADGRWVNGNYDKKIMDTLMSEMGLGSYAHFRWLQESGESRRYNYKLDDNSVVFDVGGYHGDWSEKMLTKYGSTIYVFEPVVPFYEKITERFKNTDKVKPFNFGFSHTDAESRIYLAEDQSSLHTKSNGVEVITLVDFNRFIEKQKIDKIDLMKLNIEGEEYNLLEAIIRAGNHTKIKNIQIQFHKNADAYESRRNAIQIELSKTHECTYCYDYVWENWELKKIIYGK